jgi:2-dehydro-3-deoxy-D-arabinonate dehydratase
MKIYRTRRGIVVQNGRAWHRMPEQEYEHFLNRDELAEELRREVKTAPKTAPPRPEELLSPLGRHELWACGVTYLRSREARMEEAKDAGGGDFYDRVYAADRPELFFKAPHTRVVGPGRPVRIRRDSTWNVPEPEFCFYMTATGRIVGVTIGNDMSSRSIEGENPLYLPQAKTYDGCAAVGPCLLVPDGPLPGSTPISMEIVRRGRSVFAGTTKLGRMKRTFEELGGWLRRELTFPDGVFVLTGTGIVPDDDFTLRAGDEIRITVPPVGTLVNRVQ